MSAVPGATDWAEAGESHRVLRKPLAFSPMAIALSSLTFAFGLQGEIVKSFLFCSVVRSSASERSCAFSEVPQPFPRVCLIECGVGGAGMTRGCPQRGTHHLDWKSSPISVRNPEQQDRKKQNPSKRGHCASERTFGGAPMSLL